jgi:hypothetical protein
MIWIVWWARAWLTMRSSLQHWGHPKVDIYLHFFFLLVFEGHLKRNKVDRFVQKQLFWMKQLNVMFFLLLCCKFLSQITFCNLCSICK